jgi:hypothetical protein
MLKWSDDLIIFTFSQAENKLIAGLEVCEVVHGDKNNNFAIILLCILELALGEGSWAEFMCSC